MKLRTEMQDGCVHALGYCVDTEDVKPIEVAKLEHDAAAAHALMREIANLREVARKRGSSSGQLALNLLDVMERSADERMAEWGYNE